MFKVFIGSKARKFLKRSENEVYHRIKEEIRKLENDPFPAEVERVKGLKGRKVFRVRVGDYRIQYVVYHDKKEILVFNIDKRSRAYD